MKRILAIVLIFVLAVGLSGCDELDKLANLRLPPPPAPPTQQGSVDSPAAEMEEPQYSTNNPSHVIVNISTTEQRSYDPQSGEKLILTFAYDMPVVYIEGNDTAAEKINNSIADIEENFYTGFNYSEGGSIGFGGMLTQAEDNYTYAAATGAGDINLEYECIRRADVVRADSNVLSIVFKDYIYTGVAPGTNSTVSCNFSTETGELLSFDGLFTDRDKADDTIKKLLGTDELPELDERSWYLSTEGLVIVAPSVEGGSVLVPYTALEDSIVPALIPQMRPDSGEAELNIVTQLADGSMEIIDKVYANAEGSEVFLTVSGTIYDVKLNSVTYSDRFYQNAQLWCCSYMNDCALQLVTLIPEGMPNLMFSYTTANGEQKNVLISESGENGKPIIMDAESVEAVG